MRLLEPSELVAAFQGSLHRGGVHIFEVAANGHAMGKSGNFDSGRFDQSAQVERRRFTLNGKIGSQDDFTNFRALKTLHQLGNFQVSRHYAIQRGKRTMQNVVSPPESTTPLNSQQVLWLLHYAEDRIIPGSAADAARVVFGNAEANRTKSDTPADIKQALGQGLGHPGRFQDMKCQPERRSLPDSGQLLQLTDQPGQGLREMYHNRDKNITYFYDK